MGCRDAASLKSVIQEICAEFGRVTRFDVLTTGAVESRQALCFLRLESEAQERRLIENLGLARFGREVVLVVDLPPLSGS